jgi:hypothetical protein
VKRYASNSKVPVRQTRQEIEKLLQKWGCRKVAFLDDYDAKIVEIQFLWVDEEAHPWSAMFKVSVAPDPSLSSEQKRDAEVRGRWRTLLYWLRSALDAIDAGVIQPEQVFLPFLVTPDGQTVADVMIPRMRELGAGGLLSLEPGRMV